MSRRSPRSHSSLCPPPRLCFDGFLEAVEAPPPRLCYDLQSLAANRRSKNLFAFLRSHDTLFAC